MDPRVSVDRLEKVAMRAWEMNVSRFRVRVCKLSGRLL